ncbi:3H domain-containing protein [Methanobrevibacter olleyae]|uniref:2-phosphoglycerate kinase Pgk2 n=1 Tax=Methanobrevibacter olleyae TaxID=294671 RepID=A0A126QYT5_METOL|nr:3H domain-containing protein [Methanobrevibacter olleyae]AMK14839.1 2-phosphoglycerate kinase Pgk2 [Methanobrevibacter olleyae]SFL35053.1 hypothetical protein SAMN02910297_00648 [Methanobrevibacter olleyae]
MKPYVILIGSASGIGKSTVAAELAKTLNIKHLVETDFIREVVRGIIGKEYAPALHSSSYNAYTHLRNQENYKSQAELINAGFEEHASFVLPAVERVIDRAIKDHDDIILEGVHLIPGLIDLEKFKDKASVYFFILSSDEEDHKNRFVKRAMEIRRGGKQLDYFKENRIIHDHLIEQAQKYDVKTIGTSNIDKTVKKMLSYINETCEIIHLKNSVDELSIVGDIIIDKYGASMKNISYPIKGFKEPLVRQINVSEISEFNKFVTNITKHEEKKKELEELYKLTDYRSNLICAINQDTIEKIKEDLDKEGLLYKI